MSSYFDRVQSEIGTAVSHGRHLPWHVRLRHARRARGLVVVLAALLVATPAVGAVTNWFGFGQPLHFHENSPTLGAGRAVAPTSQLLSLRVADPQGGPPWGLRLVHTTRGDVCLQFGRVEDGQLGSLGIDSAWDNDHKFHPFPRTFSGGWGQDCGTADQAGDAFLNVEWGGIASSANPSVATHGPEAKGCQTAQYEPSRIARAIRKGGLRKGLVPNGPGSCPRGASRTVFMGLLGPDATSITYQAPDGSLQTEKTTGSDGAYLLVSPLTQKTCNLYAQGPTGAHGPCGSGVRSTSNSASPISPGAVRAIHYRDGLTCSLVPPRSLLASYRRVLSALLPKRRPRGHAVPISPELQAKLERATARFAAAHQLSATRLRDELGGICPAVGYVAPNERHLTAADVESPITVGRITTGGIDAGAVISFTARQPVTSSDSWYEFAATGPRRCEADQDGPVGYGNVRAGQRLTEPVSVSSKCKGAVRGVVGYMQNGGPTDTESAGDGGIPGKDGSIVVGHFTFTMR